MKNYKITKYTPDKNTGYTFPVKYVLGQIERNNTISLDVGGVQQLRRNLYDDYIVSFGRWFSTQLNYAPFRRAERYAIRLGQLIESLWRGIVLDNGYVLHITAITPSIRGYISSPSGTTPIILTIENWGKNTDDKAKYLPPVLRIEGNIPEDLCHSIEEWLNSKITNEAAAVAS